MDNRIEEFKIADAEAHRRWEDLLGFPIQTDRVRLTRTVYEDLAIPIQAIQMSAALRVNDHE